jgi:hypothetical protein
LRAEASVYPDVGRQLQSRERSDRVGLNTHIPVDHGC